MMKALPAKMRYFIVLLFLFQSGQSAAARFCNNTPKNFILRPDIRFSNLDAPADASSYPYQVGKSAYYSENVLFDYCWPYYLRGQAVITRPVVGQYNGQDIYDIGVPNIGVTFTIADSQESGFGEGVEMKGNNLMDVIPPNGRWYLIPRMGASIRIGVIVLGRLAPGWINVPPVHVGNFSVTSSNSGVNNLGGTSFIILNGFNFFVKTKTCSLSQRNYTVQLAAVYKKQFPSVGSEVPGGKLNLQLKCQDNIDVYATLTDATDPANQSPVLSLDNASTARGMGLKIYKDGHSEALRFGPDSSVKGNTNQWRFSTYRGDPAPAVSLKVNYIRTGDIQAGTVQAISTITFSYQ
ncbi:type 1 fimbrial protein [Salmonella enterica]|nr:type 1 fimbrial protein [Salmonella enterica]EBP3676197.1 type 1 fimbrial protein [Salmonella enterica subsp. enterica]EAW9357505.1 type 1 fimbrial protein [Salmonella enterica]EAW9421705.1 type 1 fimbrial protein [Salmonella enterica]EAW9427243.1 type 1 fimbrial protein [Salmonella enterica]